MIKIECSYQKSIKFRNFQMFLSKNYAFQRHYNARNPTNCFFKIQTDSAAREALLCGTYHSFRCVAKQLPRNSIIARRVHLSERCQGNQRLRTVIMKCSLKKKKNLRCSPFLTPQHGSDGVRYTLLILSISSGSLVKLKAVTMGAFD